MPTAATDDRVRRDRPICVAPGALRGTAAGISYGILPAEGSRTRGSAAVQNNESTCDPFELVRLTEIVARCLRCGVVVLWGDVLVQQPRWQACPGEAAADSTNRRAAEVREGVCAGCGAGRESTAFLCARRGNNQCPFAGGAVQQMVGV
jgi:hypothetical protein